MKGPHGDIDRHVASSSGSVTERRRSPRSHQGRLVTLAIGADPPVSADLVDVSADGMRLLMLSPITADASAVVRLRHEPTGVWFRAKLVRSAPQPDGCYEIGVEFLDDPGGRFVRDGGVEPHD